MRTTRTTRRRLSPHRLGIRLSAFAALVVTLLLIGCAASPGPVGPATQSDRLMAAYDELRAGRFAVLADFEDPAQMEVVEFVDASNRGACVLDTGSGRPETGGAALRITVGSDHDTVLLGAGDSENWYIKRDWRPYDLLLLSLRAPRADVTAHLTIASGKGERRAVVESAVPLRRGWNLLRFNVAEIGDRLPLDDIRELRLRFTGAGRTVDLTLDDVILTTDREELLGDARGAEGSLFVQRVGRRYRVGSAGRFDLTFEHGQVVEWFNLAADPHRLVNLVGGTVLGPSPVVVWPEDEEYAGPADFRPLGEIVRARQAIAEMSVVRAVVVSEWQFTRDPEQEDASLPFQRWRYTIYPSGEVFVNVECTARWPGWEPEQLGLAVSVNHRLGFVPQVHEVAGLHDPEPLRHVAFAAAAQEAGTKPAALLYTLADSRRTPRIIHPDPEHARRLSFVATGSMSGTQTEVWSCRLSLMTTEAASEATVADRAVAYAFPPPIALQVGWPAATTATEPTAESAAAPSRGAQAFDHADGSFVLRPEDGLVRFSLDAQRHLFLSPAFRITGSKDLTTWVYVDNMLFEHTARDAEGNLVFQLPGRLRKPTTVEVLLREK